VVLKGFFFVLWAFLRGILKKVVCRTWWICGEGVVECWQNVDKKLFFAAVEKWDTNYNFIL
jgi:hypothetical protein